MNRFAPWLILILALFLRLYHLGAESVYVDEMFSLNLSALSPGAIVGATAADVHPPFYYFLLAAWMKMFGQGEVYARLLSALTGTAAVALLFHLGRRMLGRPAGLLAALMAALSPFLIHWSQEARGYMLLGLLSLISMHFFLRWMELRRPRHALGYVAVTALLIYTHTFGFFVMAAQNGWVVWQRYRTPDGSQRPPLTPWFLQQAILAALFVPWVAVLFSQVSRMRQEFYVPRPVPAKIAATFLEYAGNPASFLLYGGFAIAAAFRKSPFRPLLLSWIVLPVALPYLLSFWVVPVYITKATLPAAFPFFLLTAMGILALPGRRLKITVIAALSLISLWGLRDYYGRTHHDPWRKAAADLRPLLRPGDRVVVHPFFSLESFQYYFRHPEVPATAFPANSALIDTAKWEALDGAIAGAPRLFYFEGHGGETEGRILGKLKKDFILADSLEYPVFKYVYPERYTGLTRFQFIAPAIAPRD